MPGGGASSQSNGQGEVVLGGGASSQSNGQGRWYWQAVLVHSLMVRGGGAGRWC